MKKVSSFLLSEVAGKCFIFCGIIAEFIFRAPVYLIIVTTGSLLIFVGVELRHYKKGEM